MSSAPYLLNPIGHVVAEGGRFTLQLTPAMAPGLLALDGFSHVLVLWWAHFMDEPEQRKQTQVAKPYRRAPDEVGLFATRSPSRPNPIAVTVVPLIGVDVERGRVDLGYIDAADGTPVLDIKPYHPATDRVREARVPDWCAHWPQAWEDSASFDWESELVYER